MTEHILESFTRGENVYKYAGSGGGGTGQVSALSYAAKTPAQYESLTPAEKNNGTVYFVTENSNGASGLKIITMDEEDYEELTPAEKNNNVPYFVS